MFLFQPPYGKKADKESYQLVQEHSKQEELPFKKEKSKREREKRKEGGLVKGSVERERGRKG
jgi:hypothetical protein